MCFLVILGELESNNSLKFTAEKNNSEVEYSETSE